MLTLIMNMVIISDVMKKSYITNIGEFHGPIIYGDNHLRNAS